MRPPCETIVSVILPAIRSLITQELIENHSMKQREVAKVLGTTQSAISQYMKQKRGDQLTDALRKQPDMKEAIASLVSDITSEKTQKKDTVMTICSICMSMRNDGTICAIYPTHAEGQEDCNLCRPLSE